jgi:hypothetical protein
VSLSRDCKGAGDVRAEHPLLIGQGPLEQRDRIFARTYAASCVLPAPRIPVTACSTEPAWTNSKSSVPTSAHWQAEVRRWTLRRLIMPDTRPS